MCIERSAAEVIAHVGQANSESIVAEGALLLRGERLALRELLILARLAKAAETTEAEHLLISLFLIWLFDTRILYITQTQHTRWEITESERW